MTRMGCRNGLHKSLSASMGILVPTRRVEPEQYTTDGFGIDLNVANPLSKAFHFCFFFFFGHVL